MTSEEITEEQEVYTTTAPISSLDDLAHILKDKNIPAKISIHPIPPKGE